MRSRVHRNKKGFTVIELLVTISIFVLLTMLIISRYGTFNSGTLLTNLAYDIALSIRTAQTYGVSVKTADLAQNNFKAAYGVEFSYANPDQFLFFADGATTGATPDGVYQALSDAPISTYHMKQGSRIALSGLCAGHGSTCDTQVEGNFQTLDITYKRPDPEAIICLAGDCSFDYAQIKVTSSDQSSSRNIVVRKNGQISVEK